MTAAAATRDTEKSGTGPLQDIHEPPVKGSTKIFQGTLVVLDAGYAKPGASAAGLIALGRAEEEVDNTDGDDGDLRVKVRPGSYWWDNSSSSDEITQTEVGKD